MTHTLVTSLAVVLAVCCGGKTPPSSYLGEVSGPLLGAGLEAHWEDVFDQVPELVVMLRPRELRRDSVYGPILGQSIALARTRSRVVAATRALDALDDAEEVIVCMLPEHDRLSSELVVAVRGVRAEVDPGRLVDSEGLTLWSPGPSGGIRELLRTPAGGAKSTGGPPMSVSPSDEPEASLFELPGRTWVIATGEARNRARDAFAHPGRRPHLRFDPGALASVRISGPSLVAHVRALQGGSSLAGVGRRLRSLTLVIPGRSFDRAADSRPEGLSQERSIRAALLYEDEEAALLAAARVRDAIDAISRESRQRPPIDGGSDGPKRVRGRAAGLEWLALASVVRAASVEGGSAGGSELGQKEAVVVTVPLPRALIDELLRANLPSPQSEAPLRTVSGPEPSAR